jgi:hypothetical protein
MSAAMLNEEQRQKPRQTNHEHPDRRRCFYLALLIGRFGFLLSLTAIFVSCLLFYDISRVSANLNLTHLVRWQIRFR